MTISNNNYNQLNDYLTQVKNFPGYNITNKTIAEKLKVSDSRISLFLSGNTKKPEKMLTSFIKTYPLEFQKWPQKAHKIERFLQEKDIFYFLNKKMPSKKVQISTVQASMPIVISYRGHNDSKDAQGMLFDHMRLQSLTDFPTAILIPEEKQDKIKKLFKEALSNHPAQLPFGENNTDLKKCPAYVSECTDLGLLVIPGRVRKVEDEPVRLKHEYKIIRSALNRGQPLLGICAGSWRVWEQLIIWTKEPNKLNEAPENLLAWHRIKSSVVEVSDHVYGGGMIRLDKMGVEASYNVQIHDVMTKEKTLVREVFKENRMTVNSVHWKAVKADQLPKNVKISATAAKNPNINKNTRQGNLMAPEEHSVEAFESDFGAPIVCLQWHPEGYEKGSAHEKLLSYMAKAGQAYANKRKVLAELINHA